MTDTNTAEREALMDLIDAYAEARHVGGCHTYNAKTAEARAKVVASLAASAGSEPVAYAIFAENGNIRVWATEPQHVKRIAAEQGLKLVKLYTNPSPPEGMAGWKLVPIEPTKKMIEAGRWMEYGESSCHMSSVPDGDVIGVWSGMIAAAPTPAAQADSVAQQVEGGDAGRLLRQILAASQDGDSDTHLSAHFVSRIEAITKPGGTA